jgi:ribosomal protein S6
MSEVENKEESKISAVGEGKVYELGYLLVPTIKEEEAPAVYGNLKDLVASFGGSVIADEMPKMMTIAYPMTKVVANIRSKFTTAYFGWIKFTMSSSDVVELKKKLDFDPNVIRFLIIKTVKENTIASKRFVRGDVARKSPAAKKEGEEVEATPIDKAEIDKEIDAMIAA